MSERAPEDSLIRILLVDDDPKTAHWVSQTLATRSTIRFELTCIRHFERGRAYDHEVVLMTLEVSECLEAVKRVVAAMSDRPIVVLSVVDDDNFASRVVAAGAEDCLFIERLDAVHLIWAIRHAIERRRRIAALERIQKRDRYLATHDGLTEFPNRRLFLDYLSRALAFANRYGERLAVLFLDLDGFKTVNDELGHAAGDGLICSAAQRIRRSLRQSDTVARFGGDEFAIVLRQVVVPSVASTVTEKILRELARPFSLRGRRISITASIGISLYPRDGSRLEGLIEKADVAMYAAKRAGGNAYRFYSRLENDKG